MRSLLAFFTRVFTQKIKIPSRRQRSDRGDRAQRKVGGGSWRTFFAPPPPLLRSCRATPTPSACLFPVRHRHNLHACRSPPNTRTSEIGTCPFSAAHLEGGDLAADLGPPVLDVVVAAPIDLLGDLGEALVLVAPQLQQLLVLLEKRKTTTHRPYIHTPNRPKHQHQHQQQ